MSCPNEGFRVLAGGMAGAGRGRRWKIRGGARSVPAAQFHPCQRPQTPQNPTPPQKPLPPHLLNASSAVMQAEVHST
jgi:hypothetical protein